jgi:hypothetical protein
MNIHIKNTWAGLLKRTVTTLCVTFLTVSVCYTAKPSQDTVETGIDFVINNKSSYELKGMYISLTGNVEGRSVTFINADPGTLQADSSLSNPNNGNNVSAPPNAAITDLKLKFSTAFGGTVNIKAAIDGASPPPVDVNAYFSCYCYPDFGSEHTWNYTSGSTIPASGRRKLTITITNTNN